MTNERQMSGDRKGIHRRGARAVASGVAAGALLAGCAGMGVLPGAMNTAGGVSLNTPALKALAADPAARKEVVEAMRLLRAGAFEQAGKVCEAGLKRDPSDSQLHFLNALSYHLRARDGDRKLLELAETGYQVALKFEPDNVWAAFLLGHIAYGAQRFIDAQNYFSYGVLYQPDNAALLRGLLAASYSGQDLPTALWAAQRVDRLAPADPAARRNAVMVYAAAGRIDEARRSLAAYGALESDDAGSARLQGVQRRVAEWDDYYRRNKLSQATFSETQPFETQRERHHPAPAVPAGTGVPPAAGSPGTAAKETGPKMVMVDMVIIRTEENRSLSRGVNLLAGLQATLTGTLLSANIVRTSGSPTTRAYTINPAFTLAGLTYNMNIFNDGVERAEVLARPTLLALEGKPSEFFSGGVWHVQISGNLTYGTIEEVPIGITLRVTPQFIENDLLMIDVSAERSFLEARSADAGFTAFSQTTKTSVKATAKLRFGETLVLSGLSEHEDNRQRTGVPVLDRVPGLQYFFSNRIEQETHRSVLILLTPRKARFFDGAGSIEAAQAEAARPEQTATFTTELQKRHRLDNIDAVYTGLKHSEYFRQFRTGDMRMADWREHDGLQRLLESFLSTLYF